MRKHAGIIKELRLDTGLHPVAWVECQQPTFLPRPGQYLMGWAASDAEAPLAVPLFPAKLEGSGFLSATPVPAAWEPGTRLELSGPFGRGFDLPISTRRLALGALWDSAGHLLPLIDKALERQLAVTLYADCRLPSLPSAVEIYPLAALPEALTWADLLAVDLDRSMLPELRRNLGIETGSGLPCPIQALIRTPLPCAGMSECGACAVPGHKRWKLACTHGPVFDLRELEW